MSEMHRKNKQADTKHTSKIDIAEIMKMPLSAEGNYAEEVEKRAEKVFAAASKRYSAENMERLKKAFDIARHAHGKQRRKSGEPYIFHPIAVAGIVVNELQLDADTAIAAFLHDVVEDTELTIDDILKLFGHDVAFLVRVVTKQIKDNYTNTKQIDNFRQLLNSVEYDIRAMLVKLADRLHNMRTLDSMRPDKQMKIAGETDYFYAPFANRLGYYNVKSELENLSLKFRCPHEYEHLVNLIENDRKTDAKMLKKFTDKIKSILSEAGIQAKVSVDYRQPYSIWRKMIKTGDDYNHIKHKHFIDIIFDGDNLSHAEEKRKTLDIYSALTNYFKEKPGGITNYIDTPKENGYQSFHIKLLSDVGRWEEVHISSERMVRDSERGCMSPGREGSIHSWIDKFKSILRDISLRAQDDGSNFIEEVVTAFYNDDIMTFTPKGKPVVLPKNSTVLDFAFEIHSDLGLHAWFARINNQLSSVKSVLHRGDVVEIFTKPDIFPEHDWLNYVHTYKARKAIRSYLSKKPVALYDLCECCHPLPGEEVIGFRDASTGKVTVHKRDCTMAIRLASQYGDSIVSVDFFPDESLFPVSICIKAVDRYHLLIELVECITDTFGLTMDSFNTERADAIVTCHINFSVHGYDELQSIINHIENISGVDEVKLLK